jgi:hypothetical protein
MAEKFLQSQFWDEEKMVEGIRHKTNGDP